MKNLNYLYSLMILAIRVSFVLILGYTIYSGYWSLLLANFLLLSVYFIFLILKQRYSLNFPPIFEVFFTGVILFSFIAGYFLPDLIQLSFGLTMGLVGFSFSFLFFNREDNQVHFMWIFLFSVFTSVSIVSFFEVLKFYLKFILGYSFSTGDYAFAMKDIFFVFLGAIFSSGLGLVYFKFFRGKLFVSLISTFKKENPGFFLNRTSKIHQVKNTISEGENEKIEFKSTLRINLLTGESDKRIEHSVLRAISSFLNGSGGYVFIGVTNNSEIIGISKDGFENSDLFSRHLTNLIKQKLGSEYLPYLGFDFFNFNGKIVLRILCKKSSRPVFLKSDEKEEFFVRAGVSSLQLSGNSMINYIFNNFSNR